MSADTYTLGVARDALNEGDEFDATIADPSGLGGAVLVLFTHDGLNGAHVAVEIEDPDGNPEAFMVVPYVDQTRSAGPVVYADTPDALVEAVTAIRKELV